MASYVNKLVVQDAGQIKKVGAADSVQIDGAFTAGTLAGDGNSITNLSSAALSGALPAIDGSALTSLSSAALTGALPAIDGSSLTALSSSALSGALPAIDGSSLTALSSSALSGALPALDGSALTSLNASSLSSGTVGTSLLSGSYTGVTGVGALSAGSIGAGFTAIDDTHLSTISTAGKVSNTATTATDANTASAIVARDASGNFSAGTITADLTGTASYANQWPSARDIEFSGGDVTGTVSGLDGSGNPTATVLTIGASVVENAMLAGSISDDKLDTISTAGKVADSALSANVPLLDAASNAFTGSMSIAGSLNVTGPIISDGEMNVIVHDAFLDLSAGNVGTVAKASGLSFNIKKATGFTTEQATAFVAGVVATSAPTMAMSATSSLAAGDIVEVHGTIDGTNDGLYVVASVAGTGTSTVVTIKGIGGTLPSVNVPFTNNQFTASTNETASVIKVDLAAFAVSGGALTGGAGAIAAGNFCYNYQAAATESSFASSWTALNAVATPDLASVYAAGANANIVLSNGRNFSIAKPTSGTAAISLEANLASKFEVDGAQLDIKTSGTAADVVLTASRSVKVASPLMLPTGDGSTVVSSGVGFIQSVANGVSEGDLLYIDTDGVAKKASNSGRKAQVVALESNGGGSAANKRVTSVRGAKVYITVTGGAAAGDTLYLSSTAGQATKTAPTTNLLQSLGEVIGAAIGTHYPVIFEPRVIVDDLGA